MNGIVLNDSGKSIYLTARDSVTQKSKTITIRGVGITPESVLAFVSASIRRKQRKGGR